MPHSSGLGRKAVSLPRQTSDVFLLQLFFFFFTLHRPSFYKIDTHVNHREVGLFSWHAKDVFV